MNFLAFRWINLVSVIVGTLEIVAHLRSAVSLVGFRGYKAVAPNGAMTLT